MAHHLLVDESSMQTATESQGTRSMRSSFRSRLLARRARRAGSLGFTLIELSIVVTIVGILSILAVVGYRKMILAAKLTEAENMISGIRIAQESYRTERGTYLDIGNTFCPTDGTAQQKTGWDPITCAGGAWGQLPVHADGPVQFGYRTRAGAKSFADPFTLSWVSFPATLDTTLPWYVIHAQADLDGSGGGCSGATDCTELVGSSFGNQIFNRNVGR